MTQVAAGSNVPDAEDAAVARDAAKRVRAYLADTATDDPGSPVRLQVAGEEEQLVVPRQAVDLLARVLGHMAAGQGVSVVPSHAELTTQQAADLLNVSRPFLIGLLDAGEIEYRMVGTHRRILASSLMDYKKNDDARRRGIADELSALSNELGLD